MNLRILLLKILMLLFHSFIFEGKKEVLNSQVLNEAEEYFLSFVQSIWFLVEGLIEKYNCLLNILIKKQRFLNQPNS